jgi:hypothetical protein
VRAADGSPAGTAGAPASHWIAVLHPCVHPKIGAEQQTGQHNHGPFIRALLEPRRLMVILRIH